MSSISLNTFNVEAKTSSLPNGAPLSLTPVRVVDIILDESHPEFNKYGNFGLGAIKYTYLERSTDNTNTENLPFAFPLSSRLKELPLINEIVFLIPGPSYYSTEIKSSAKFMYYTSILNVWNSPTNPLPLITQATPNPELGVEFEQNLGLRSLYPFHGDTILEGRHGQSIRMTGARSFKNTFSDKTNAGKPLTIITNGHEPTRSSEDTNLYIEDINKDSSSIYLSSDHLIPLEQIRDKFSGAVDRPVLANSYQGKQIILNSGRLIFNSYESDTIFSTFSNFGITAEQIHLDGESSIGLDAEKIYLGEQARINETEPIILGNSLEIFLDDLLSGLKSLSNSLKKARTVDQKPIPLLNKEGWLLEETVNNLKTFIKPNGDSRLKSKKSFVE